MYTSDFIAGFAHPLSGADHILAMVATAALHAVGLGAGLLLARSSGESLLRATGGLVAVSGLALVAGIA